MAARLGQHFLTSRAALARIVEAAELQGGETVLEIGPGKGILTEALLAAGARVVAVEKDEQLVEKLKEKFEMKIRAGELRVALGDIRDMTPEKLRLPGAYSIVANIPYYLTGAIIRQFLTAKHQPSRMVLLIQKEVAERIARSKKESLLSLSVKVYGNPRIAARVPRGAFSPPPKVDSAILCIDNISRKKFKNENIHEHVFFALIHAGFAQKRKQLASNLAKHYPRERVGEAFNAAKLSRTVRAEDVPLAKWRTLVQFLK